MSHSRKSRRLCRRSHKHHSGANYFVCRHIRHNTESLWTLDRRPHIDLVNMIALDCKPLSRCRNVDHRVMDEYTLRYS